MPSLLLRSQKTKYLSADHQLFHLQEWQHQTGLQRKYSFSSFYYSANQMERPRPIDFQDQCAFYRISADCDQPSSKRYCSANQTGRPRPISSWAQSTLYCTSADSDKPSSKMLCYFSYTYRPKAILLLWMANCEAYKTKSIISTLVIVMIKGFQIIDTK